jgi:hypothetical protein
MTDTTFAGIERHKELCPACKGYCIECTRCKDTGIVEWIICPVCEGMDPVNCYQCDGEVRIDL